ncbi:MAG: hypothetical protein C0501_15930 [Isosphaera sp.]|nr:hypothetical protein [Isosphaera sp.]
MSVRFLAATVAAVALAAGPAAAADPPKKPDPVETLLDKLFDEEVKFEGNVNEQSFKELLTSLSRRHGFAIVINYAAIAAEDGTGPDAVNEHKPRVVADELKGMRLGAFLDTVLFATGRGHTYLVRNGYLEIVPPAYAAKVTKSATTDRPNGAADARVVPAHPLVSAVLKEKPLTEAVALVAERYDLTVVVAPQAGDARAGFVSARLLNVPADKALDLLAVQADLRVVRKGTAFLLTSRDHANEMANEKLEKERQKIELEKFRNAPPVPPAPEPKP